MGGALEQTSEMRKKYVNTRIQLGLSKTWRKQNFN